MSAIKAHIETGAADGQGVVPLSRDQAVTSSSGTDPLHLKDFL